MRFSDSTALQTCVTCLFADRRERLKGHPRRVPARGAPVDRMIGAVRLQIKCSLLLLSALGASSPTREAPSLCQKGSHDRMNKTKLTKFGVEFARLRHVHLAAPTLFAHASRHCLKADCPRQCKKSSRFQQPEGRTSTESDQTNTERNRKQRPKTAKHTSTRLGPFELLANSPPPMYTNSDRLPCRPK